MEKVQATVAFESTDIGDVTKKANKWIEKNKEAIKEINNISQAAYYNGFTPTYILTLLYELY